MEERTQQLKAAHQKLLHSDRLASLGQLSASVAHEINNPISGVLNLSMLLQRMLKDDGIPPERIQEFRKYLTAGDQRDHARGPDRVGPAGLLAPLQAAARAGRPEQDRPHDALAGAAQDEAEQRGGGDQRWREDLPAVPCDPSQIQQVVLNLLLNAAEATQSKAASGRRDSCPLAADGGMVRLMVADNGEGIAPENLARIFDPFFTTKPEGKGVGLGLAVSYGIIQAHGGDIEVKSKVGEGATFTVSLPLDSRRTARPELPLPGSSAPEGMKYLYVAASPEVEPGGARGR